MNKSDLHEALATLYLRLIGYFTTGLILHSGEWGQALTEIDCLAIRLPHHAQPEREVKTADFLNPDNQEALIDILICEVKSCPDQLNFNAPIKSYTTALQAALRWAGAFTEDQVISVAKQFQPLLQDDVSADGTRSGVIEGSCRVRPLLCCPTCDNGATDRWCLTGDEIFCYINECFNPAEPRDSCSTRYNFQQWGYPLTPIVQFFKNSPGTQKSLDELYNHLDIQTAPV
jgi:hypothetical protein